MRARAFLPGPDALSFGLETRLSHHPRSEEGRVSLFGIGRGQRPDLIFRHEPLRDIEQAANRSLVDGMGIAARTRASEFTWRGYGESIVATVRALTC